MTVLRPRLAATASLLFLLTTPAAARAGDPAPAARGASATPGDKGMAEALFRAAKDLQAEGKVTEACAKYVESHRLDPKPGTILNVAACHEEEGRTATAWADYAEAATFAARAHQSDREQLARAKVDELGKKLSYVTFRFPDVAALVVLLDGQALTTASAGTRVPIDPGDHNLDARAPGRVSWAAHVKIDAGPSERTVVVPVLTVEGATVSSPAVGATSSAPSDASTHDGSTQRTLGWVAMGVGVAGVGAGTIFGVRTLSKKSTVDEHCVASRCDDTGLRANQDAKDSATLSTITFAVGGAALVAGIVLFLTAPRSTSGPNSSQTSGQTSVARALLTAGSSGSVLEGVW